MLFAARGAVGRAAAGAGLAMAPRGSRARRLRSGEAWGKWRNWWFILNFMVKDGPDGSGAGQGTVGGGTRPQPALLLLTPNNQGRTSMITLFSNPMALAVRHEFWLLSKPGVRCG